MRVLLYSDFYQSPSGFGREARDFLRIAMKTHQVRQVALGCDGTDPNTGNVLCYPTRGPGVSSHFAPEILDRAIEDFRPEILISIHDYLALPHIAEVVKAPRKSPPRWIHWGTLDASPIPELHVKAAAKVDLHLTQSDFAQRTLIEGFKFFGFPSQLIHTVYPCIDLHAFSQSPDRQKMRQALGIDDRWVVGCVARNQFRKNIPVLMEAVSIVKEKIPNILLCLHSIPTTRVDGGSDSYDVEALLKYFKLENHMRVVVQNGPLDDAALNNFYNIANVHCLPTMGEGFGLPLAEAMAAKIPNIATDCSSCTELLADGRGLLVKPAASIWVSRSARHAVLSADALAESLAFFHDRPALQADAIQRSAEWVKQLHPEVAVPKILSFFEP